MASSLTQDKHICPPGHPRRAGQAGPYELRTAVEGVSELFEYRINALSREGNIDFDSLLGRNCTVTFNTQGSGKRFFDGILAEAQWLGPTPGEQQGGRRARLQPCPAAVAMAAVVSAQLPDLP